MKTKTIFGALGIIVILAGTVYVIVKYFERKKAENKKDAMDHQNDDDKQEVLVVTSEKQGEPSNLNEIKSEVAESIEQRHEEAKSLMEEAVKNIMSDDTPEQTKNDEEKKQLFADIDKL